MRIHPDEGQVPSLGPATDHYQQPQIQPQLQPQGDYFHPPPPHVPFADQSYAGMEHNPFADFLRDLLYEPGMDQQSSLHAGPRPDEAGAAHGLSVLNFCDDANIELDDLDFSVLDSCTMDTSSTYTAATTAPTSISQAPTPQADESVDMSQMRRSLVKIWTDSPWRWAPVKTDSGYGEQDNLPVPSDDTAAVKGFRETARQLGKVVAERLAESSRDRILAVVLASCRSDLTRTRVASSFPAADVMDTLVHIALASHMCQVSEYIHFGSLVLNAQWPEWLAIIGAMGATQTPVPTLRKFGLAIQEAVRLALPGKVRNTPLSRCPTGDAKQQTD